MSTMVPQSLDLLQQATYPATDRASSRDRSTEGLLIFAADAGVFPACTKSDKFGLAGTAPAPSAVVCEDFTSIQNDRRVWSISNGRVCRLSFSERRSAPRRAFLRGQDFVRGPGDRAARRGTPEDGQPPIDP